MNDPQINTVTLSSGTPRNEREALFQQTIKDLTQRNKTLAYKCSLREHERDTLRSQLAQAQGFYAKIADFYATHENPLQSGMAKAIAEAIRASVHSEPAANAQAPDGEGEK